MASIESLTLLVGPAPYALTFIEGPWASPAIRNLTLCFLGPKSVQPTQIPDFHGQTLSAQNLIFIDQTFRL